MTTRFDQFTDQAIEFLLLQKKCGNISEAEYKEVYFLIHDWAAEAEELHPREEDLEDCYQLQEEGKHI
jgi:hypothetical protein